jgi:hypothetical protein
MVPGDQLDSNINDICKWWWVFFSIEDIVNLAKKMLKTKNDSLERVFHIGIFIYQIVITSTSCNCYSEDSFLCDAYYQE